MTLLEVKNLKTQFSNGAHPSIAVNDVSFHIDEKETIALVGESGCGKSVTAMSIMRLIDEPGEIAEGEIFLKGIDLLKISKREMQNIRGNDIGMIFQEPMTSLNPVYTVGDQIAEAIALHKGISYDDAWGEAVLMLKKVRIPSPEKRAHSYPHELSGGMKQRVIIAIGLCCNPSLLIADEPTTALDVTIQAQILELLAELQNELGLAVLLITHDLGVVAQVAKRVVVMYASKIVETASVEDLFAHPTHPYTQGLLNAIPNPGGEKNRLAVISGYVPPINNLPTGCKFHPRCPSATEKCKTTEPTLTGDNHKVACHYAKKMRTSPAFSSGGTQ